MREFSTPLRVAVAALLTLSLSHPAHAQKGKRVASAAPFSVVEASIPEMRAALESGRVTSHQLVQQYLTRIALYEDKLNAIITVNPNALAVADSLDRERASGRVRGPLHGIPIALKDNINTVDMPTTGGAVAFADFVFATLARSFLRKRSLPNSPTGSRRECRGITTASMATE